MCLSDFLHTVLRSNPGMKFATIKLPRDADAITTAVSEVAEVNGVNEQWWVRAQPDGSLALSATKPTGKQVTVLEPHIATYTQITTCPPTHHCDTTSSNCAIPPAQLICAPTQAKDPFTHSIHTLRTVLMEDSQCSSPLYSLHSTSSYKFSHDVGGITTAGV